MDMATTPRIIVISISQLFHWYRLRRFPHSLSGRSRACPQWDAVEERGGVADYQWRLPTSVNMLQANAPVTQNDTILFTAMVPAGYHTAVQKDDGINFDTGAVDQLAVTATSLERWTEKTERESMIV
jgi:hypothetical protein